MKKFIYSYLIIICSILFLCGCQTPVPQQSIEMQSMLRSRKIIRTSLQKDPQSRPYFENVGSIVCSASSKQNTDAIKVENDIRSIPATPIEKSAADDLLFVWLNETNNSNKQLVLRGICRGAEIALYSYTGQSLVE